MSRNNKVQYLHSELPYVRPPVEYSPSKWAHEAAVLHGYPGALAICQKYKRFNEFFFHAHAWLKRRTPEVALREMGYLV